MAMQVVIKYRSTEIVPILPKVETLLKFDTPLTIEKNTTGTINIFRDDINKIPGTSIKSIITLSCKRFKQLKKDPRQKPKPSARKIFFDKFI